jgi:K+-sensing histidine kinase KdpD
MAESSPAHTTGGSDEDVSMSLLERLAHDLRGPLSPLQTAAYLLRRDEVDQDRRNELLEIIDRQTTRLSAMVQEVSDWTRARQSRLVEHRGPVEVSVLVELACAPAGSAVQLELPESLDTALVDGDTQRLVQMLSTLVAFMQAKAGEGGVSVRASATEGATDIFIAATNAAWDEGESESLFQRPQGAPFDHGLGMRLLLARAIAEAHGGTVMVDEPRSDGARLRARLPLAT